MNWKEWYKKQVEAQGPDWREHGAKVGDRVQLHCENNWTEDCDYDELDGYDVSSWLVVKDGSTGRITRLYDNRYVMVEFTAQVTYMPWDDVVYPDNLDFGDYDEKHLIKIECVPDGKSPDDRFAYVRSKPTQR